MMLREWSDWGGSVSRRERRKASSVYVVSAVMPCFALMIALTMGWKKSRFLAFHMVQALALQVLAFTAVAVFLSVGALAEGIGFERVRAVLLIVQFFVYFGLAWVLPIMGVVQSERGAWRELPLVGAWARRRVS